MIHIWIPNPQAPLRLWQETNQTWQNVENWQELATLVNLQFAKVKNKSATLYFPSLHLLKIEPELSPQQLKQLGESGRQYLFEDISIGSVDDLQIKSWQGENHTTLYALHGGERDTWMNAAQLAGIEIVALLPDFLLLPLTDAQTLRQATFYQDDTTQILRYGSHGLAVSYLPLQLSKMPQLESVLLLNPSTELIEQLSVLPNLSFQTSKLPPTPISEPTRQLLNFAVIKRDTKISPYAKVIISVLLGTLLTWFIVDGLRWFYYQKADQQAKLLIKKQYEQWFPNEKYNVNLKMKTQLSGKLIDEQSNNANIMTVLSSIQPVLRQHDITAQQLNFQNNHLQLQLIAKDNDTLNKAVATIKGQGINAKLGNVNHNGTSPNNNPSPPNNPTAAETPTISSKTTGTVEITL